MPLTSFADGALFGERLDSEPLRVLALHGWARRGADFKRALSGLGSLALDLPGFGASPAPDEVMGTAGYAEAIDAVFAEFDRPPVVVGHSMGGRVAVVHEAMYPGTAGGMVLVGAPLLRSQRPVTQPPLGYRLVRFGNRIGLISDERLEREKRSRGSADYRATTGVLRDVLVTVVNESYEDELTRIDLPVHLLWGADDTEVPVEIAERSADLIGSRAWVESVDGVGHLLPTQAPEVLRSAVESMLESTHE